MPEIIGREKLQDLTVTVADHHKLWVERFSYADGTEEIVGSVPTGTAFGDWRSEEPGTDMSPTPEEVCRDVGSALGFAVKLAELDGGIVVNEDGPIEVHFERGEEKPAETKPAESAGGEKIPEEIIPNGIPTPVNRLPDAPDDADPLAKIAAILGTRESLASVVAEMLRENQSLKGEINSLRLDGKLRLMRAHKIVALRSKLEQKKKETAEVKAALEGEVLGWVDEELADHPLWDYAEKQAVSANGTPANGMQTAHTPAATTDDSWKLTPLTDLGISVLGKEHGLTEYVLKLLADADLKTLGDLTRYQEVHGQDGHAAPLTKIRGLKNKASEQIDNACAEFWRRRGVTRETAAAVVDKVAAATEIQERTPAPEIDPMAIAEASAQALDQPAESTDAQKPAEKSTKPETKGKKGAKKAAKSGAKKKGK